jgi:hypothetical protein
MKAPLQRLFAEYVRALHAQRFRDEDLDLGRLDYHLPLLERLDAEDSSVVYDMGYDREEALGQGPEYFYRRMPEGDLETVLDTVTRTLRSLLASPPLDWTRRRRPEHFVWAARVMERCRGVSPELEAAFDRARREGPAALGAAAQAAPEAAR